MGHKIPAFVADKTLLNSRHLATTALANSDPNLIARNLIEGATKINKFGAAEDVGLLLRPITTSQTYKTPTTATALEVLSDSIDDNGSTSPLGSGALSIRIFGIADWDDGEIAQDIILEGTSVVAIPINMLRIHRVKVNNSGTYASDEGSSHDSTITIRESGGGVTWAVVGSETGFGTGQSEIAVYSVPRGKEAYIQHAEIWVESNKTATVLFFVRENADVITAPYSPMQAKIVLRHIVGSIHIGPKSPYGPFVGPCDIGWMGRAEAQTANIEIDFEIHLYDIV